MNGETGTEAGRKRENLHLGPIPHLHLDATQVAAARLIYLRTMNISARRPIKILGFCRFARISRHLLHL